MSNLPDALLKANSFKKFVVEDMLFVEYTCEPADWRSKIWSHCSYFTYVVSGEMRLQTPANEYTIEAGNCYFVRKGGCIVYPPRETKFCDLIIFMPDEFIRSIIDKYQIQLNPVEGEWTSDLVNPLNLDTALTGYYQSLFALINQAKPPAKVLLKLKFEELLVQILTNRENKTLNHYFARLCNTSKISIREIMENNYCNNLQIRDFARLCSRSLSTFRRDFFKIYGTTPGKWLVQKRLEYGAYLLKTTDKKMDDILFETGFQNRSHFIKVFKAEFGWSPRKYRKLKR